ncbi:MAG TPA: helix-turn-helix transcriptional regulator [Accumulibacter sp.]|nr:helix-turn-helix transcriptional regulator [Accumulibacter sp.]
MDDRQGIVRLANKLSPAATDRKSSPRTLDSLSAGGHSRDSRDWECHHAKDHPLSGGASRARISSCRKTHPDCDFSASGGSQCPECAFQDDSPLKPAQVDRLVESLLQDGTTRGLVEQAVHEVYSWHVAAILLQDDALVVGCDDRGQSFLKNACIMKVANGYLHCSDPAYQPRFLAALEKTACTGRAANLLLYPIGHPEQRFSMALVKIQDRKATIQKCDNSSCSNILCVLSPLDQRRFATGRQLMELFALSAAEARLTRALCQGNSLEEYASDQGLKLPTVRTQLRSVLAKTGTGRQATLIRLVAGIPVIRENG